MDEGVKLLLFGIFVILICSGGIILIQSVIDEQEGERENLCINKCAEQGYSYSMYEYKVRGCICENDKMIIKLGEEG